MRTVPLNKVALFVMDQLGRELFNGMNREHVSRKFAHYVKEAEFSGFKLHSLRHTFATNLVSAGVDIYTVSRLLGHSDIRTSLVYMNAKVDTLRDAVKQLEVPEAKRYKSVTEGKKKRTIR